MSDWADGETRQVQGSGKKPYDLKYIGGVYSCSCPAWRNQSAAIDKRTCKHLKQLRGTIEEEARVSGNATPAQKPVALANTLNVIGTQTGRMAAGLNLSNPPRDARVLFGCACERGSSCDVAHDPDACACAMCGGEGVTKEERIAAMEKAVGRKLRPDEKTKLNGPKILLAHHYGDDEVDPAGWWCSEKLDGVRAYWDGRRFLSRQGNVFHAPEWFVEGLPDHPLDGELWMGRQKFQQTISVVRSVDAGERWRQLTYVVFDVPHLKLPFEERMVEAMRWEGERTPKYARVHLHEQLRDVKHLHDKLDELVGQGAEGVMIRKPGSQYEEGRSTTLLKVKPWREDEARVIGYEAGKGRHKGRIGGLVVRTPEGVEFNVGTGLSDEDRRRPPKVGATVTYRYTGDKTEDGVPKGASYVCTRDYE